jgi:hypothetical protein
MRWLRVIGFLLALGQSSVGAQEEALNQAANVARTALEQHDTEALLAAAGDGVRIQLPGAEPSAPVSKAQGAALVGLYLDGGEEVATTVGAARVISAGRGYVELVREYRVAGTAETRQQSVLLGYRLAGDEWVLSELRIARN